MNTGKIFASTLQIASGNPSCSVTDTCPFLDMQRAGFNFNVLSWFREDPNYNSDEDEDETPAEDRVPTLWWTVGLALSTIMCCAILATMFNMNVGEAILSLILGFLFSFIGVQSAGTTDVNPVSTVAKVSRTIELDSAGLSNVILVFHTGISTHLRWYRQGRRTRATACGDHEFDCRCCRRRRCWPVHRHDRYRLLSTTSFLAQND